MQICLQRQPHKNCCQTLCSSKANWKKNKLLEVNAWNVPNSWRRQCPQMHAQKISRSLDMQFLWHASRQTDRQIYAPIAILRNPSRWRHNNNINSSGVDTAGSTNSSLWPPRGRKLQGPSDANENIGWENKKSMDEKAREQRNDAGLRLSEFYLLNSPR